MKIFLDNGGGTGGTIQLTLTSDNNMLITVILLALGGSVLSAQTTASVQGTVTDEQNKPVAGALVTITRTFKIPTAVVTPYSQAVKTASDGSFLAQGLPPGSY